jgi:hypothetical protein
LSRYVVTLIWRCGEEIHMMLYVLQKYLLLQSLRAMRTTNTNVLITRSKTRLSTSSNHMKVDISLVGLLLILELGLGIGYLQDPD